MKSYKGRTDAVGKEISRSKKVDRCFALARNIASNSPYGKIRHGALLVKGGSVINASFNKENYSLKHVGVKRVYYTTNDNTIEMYKL